jgi:hypothetical protein
MFELLYRTIRKQSVLLLLITYLVVCLLVAFVMVMTSTGSSASRQESFTIYFMSEAAILLFITPLLAVNRIDFEMRGATIAQFISTQGHWAKATLKIFGSPLLIAVLLCLISGFAALIIRGFIGDIAAAGIMKASLMALPIAVFALSIGFYCSIICKTVFSAAGLALLLLVLICTEPIWLGPLINRAPESSFLIQFSLLINPFIGMASALDFDLLRTDPFYQISPIGQLRFHYPSCWSAASVQFLMALAIFWRSAVGIRRMIIPSD